MKHGVVRMVLATAALFAAVTEAETPAAEPAPAPSSFIKDSRLDLDAVVAYFEELYRSDSSLSEAELTVTRPRRTRSLRMRVWTKGENKALIVILAPAREKDTATLKVEKNLWNYLPRIRRTIRIPPSMMLGSWMGTDFTNDDLVKESSLRDDYTYRLVGHAHDDAGWLIAFEAKPDTVGLWQRFELLVSEDGRIPVRAQYYDRRGRLSRTLHWSEVKTFDGKRVPSRLTLIPEDEKGNKTEMVYHDIDFDVDVADGTFSLSTLERKR
ncbi:outer membrane lipoprotein-sorting protein [Verrucomicrobiota bacterium]